MSALPVGGIAPTLLPEGDHGPYDDVNISPAPGAWAHDGVCTGKDYTSADFQFDGVYARNSTEYKRAKARAQAACGRCPVQAQCKKYALDQKIEGGVWGGLTWPAREAILYPRKRVDKAQDKV